MNYNEKYTKLDSKFAVAGFSLGMSLIMLGGFERFLLGRAVTLVPFLAIVFSLLGLVGLVKNRTKGKRYPIIGLIIGFAYLYLCIHG